MVLIYLYSSSLLSLSTQSAILLQVSFTKSRIHWNTIDITSFSRLSWLVCFINLLCSPETDVGK